MNVQLSHYVIVARDRPDLLERAVARFGGNAQFEVIVDRRQGERRRRLVFPKVDRRHGDRRRVPEGAENLRIHPVAIILKRGPVSAGGNESDQPASAPLPAAPSTPPTIEGLNEIHARLEQWRRDTEWVLTDVVPTLLARVEALQRERAELKAEVGVSLAQLDELVRALRVGSAAVARLKPQDS